jgi:hypothetical protein
MPAFDALQLGSTNKTLNRLSQSSRVWEQQIEVGLGISLSQLESQPELQGEFENPSGDRSYLRIYKLLDMLPEDYAEYVLCRLEYDRHLEHCRALSDKANGLLILSLKETPPIRVKHTRQM